MTQISFTTEELTAIVQCADLAIKAGGLQNARVLVPICDKIALATAPKLEAIENAGEPKQP